MMIAPAPHTLIDGASMARTRWLRQHALLPFGCLILASAILMGAGGDRWIADHLYALEGHQWALKNAWLTKQLIHLAGKRLSVAAGLFSAMLAIGAWCSRRWLCLRWPATYLVTSVALATLCVSVVKRVSGMDCPWDLIAYGGPRPYIPLLASRHGLAASGCFPAGHASAGYAWVALYFAVFNDKPHWRGPALAIGLGLGCLFGFSQQARGAHFMSHDLWALAICWYIALALYVIGVKLALLRQDGPEPRRAPAPP